jgi:DNA-binding MarR family transcriptional regulator
MNNYEKIKLDNQLCFSLYAISREVMKLYTPILEKYNLTYTQYVAMLVLWEKEKITFKSMARKLYLDSGTLTPVLKKLEKMELIVKYKDKFDDRMVIIELSEKGRKMKEEILGIPDEITAKFKTETKELIKLKEGIDKLLNKLG